MASGKARRVAGIWGSARGLGVKKVLRPVRPLIALRIRGGGAPVIEKRPLDLLPIPLARLGAISRVRPILRPRRRRPRVRLRLAIPLAPPAVRQRRRLRVPVPGRWRARLNLRRGHRARHRVCRRLQPPRAPRRARLRLRPGHHAPLRARLHLRRGHRAALNVLQRAHPRALRNPRALLVLCRLRPHLLGLQTLHHRAPSAALLRLPLCFLALTCGLLAQCS